MHGNEIIINQTNKINHPNRFICLPEFGGDLAGNPNYLHISKAETIL